MVLTLEDDDTYVIEWCIDEANGVHHYMRSHTGKYMTLGKYASYSSSVCQKIYTIAVICEKAHSENNWKNEGSK